MSAACVRVACDLTTSQRKQIQSIMYRLIVSRPENLLMGEVFGFAAADGWGAAVLCGKGAGLAAMAGQGLNGPPGFIITTQACNESRRTGGLGQHLLDQLFSELGEL